MLLQPGKKNQNKSGEIYFVKPQFIVLKDPKGFAALEWAMRQDASDQACCTIDTSQLSTLSFFGFFGKPRKYVSRTLALALFLVAAAAPAAAASVLPLPAAASAHL